MNGKPRQGAPNIVFVMSDDHAAHAISCYRNLAQQRGINQTPNIDRLADEGALFTNCFCTNSICSPSRASILTGTYNHVNGVTTLATHMDNRLVTFPKILREVGYQTAVVGKWHLGTGPAHQPAGFDYWNVLPGQGNYHDPDMIEMGERKKVVGYVTDLITDFSLEWLERRDRSRPFCLLCHHKAPHRSWEPDEKHAAMYEDVEVPYPATFDDDYSNRAAAAAAARMRVESDLHALDLKIMPVEGVGWLEPIPVPDELDGYAFTTDDGTEIRFSSRSELKAWKYQRFIKDYLRCVASVDDNVGRLLDFLDEEGISGDTVFVYTSDQGFFLGDHGWYDKRFMYEESLRMPFLLRYPREVTPGTTVEDIVLNVDFAQTFLDLAGVTPPAAMQGYSFRPLLSGETPPDWRDAFYYRYWMNGTFHNVAAHYGIRTRDYKLVYYYSEAMGQEGATNLAEPLIPEWELFDLREDPYELKNIYGDPGYEPVVEKLKARLHELQDEVGDLPVEEVE
ncbi:MAG: sulfatase family protein [Promethearchaeota archaeon]